VGYIKFLRGLFWLLLGCLLFLCLLACYGCACLLDMAMQLLGLAAKRLDELIDQLLEF